LPIFPHASERRPDGALGAEGINMAITKTWKFTPAMLALATACACAPRPSLLSEPAAAGPRRNSDGAAKPALTVGERAEHSSGLVVHIDPVTGQIVPTLPAAASAPLIPAPQFHSMPMTDSDFIEETSPLPGGGIKVHLKRRFHQPLTATTQPDGRTRIEHKSAGAQSESK
jgi:hypothetical protein